MPPHEQGQDRRGAGHHTPAVGTRLVASTIEENSYPTVTGRYETVPLSRPLARYLSLTKESVALLAGEPHHVAELPAHAHHEPVLRRVYRGAPHS